MDLAKLISSHESFSDGDEKTWRQTKFLSSVKNQTEINSTEEWDWKRPSQFWRKNLKNLRFKKYLKSLHKSKVLTQDINLAIFDDHNQIRIARTSDDLEKSELFDNFFSNIECQISPDQVYEKKENNFIKFSQDEIKDALSNLDANKACRPDNVSNTVLENLSKLSKSLLLAFQTCINNGYFLSQRKISEITYIYKEKEKADISQYRPISLLTKVSKVFEIVIFQHLYSIIEARLEKRQFEFRNKRSAVLQFFLHLKEVNELYEAAKSEHIYALYMDFKNVFEKVAHEKLFETSALVENCSRFWAAYLRERKQCVKVNNARSSFRIVTSGSSFRPCLR